MSLRVILVLLCFTSGALAEPFWRAGPRDSVARRIAAAEGDTALATARIRNAQKSRSLPYGMSPAVAEEARKAVAAYERALLAAGADDAELHWRSMLAASYADVQGSSSCRACRDMYLATVRHAEGFLAADPADPRARRVLWLACLALSKLGGLGGDDAEKHLRRAIAFYGDYRRLFDVGEQFYNEDVSLAYANQAELHMAVGELETAIELYQLAADLKPSEPLNLYGLAVAYDRDGQWGKAYATMREALVLDPQLNRIDAPSVFFVPEGDIHYYRALAFHVAAIRDRNQARRGEARTFYQYFLQGERTGRWHERAREHLRELGPAKETAPSRRPGSDHVPEW